MLEAIDSLELLEVTSATDNKLILTSLLEDALFMMETSGGSRLSGRQSCGVESAARKAG